MALDSMGHTSVCVITKLTATAGRGYSLHLVYSGNRDMLPRPQKIKWCFSESAFHADSNRTLHAKMSFFHLKKDATCPHLIRQLILIVTKPFIKMGTKCSDL